MIAFLPSFYKFKDYENDLIISSFSSFKGVVVPILPSAKVFLIKIVEQTEENGYSLIVSNFEFDNKKNLFIDTCIFLKKYFGEHLHSIYFNYLDDSKSMLEGTFHIRD